MTGLADRLRQGTEPSIIIEPGVSAVYVKSDVWAALADTIEAAEKKDDDYATATFGSIGSVLALRESLAVLRGLLYGEMG